jgi:hypothetical protein
MRAKIVPLTDENKHVFSTPYVMCSHDHRKVFLGYWHCGHSGPIVTASGDSEDVCGEADRM